MELSKPSSRDAEAKYASWRYRLATGVARGTIDLFRLKGIARTVVMEDLPYALDLEEERQAALAKKNWRQRKQEERRQRIRQRKIKPKDQQ